MIVPATDNQAVPDPRESRQLSDSSVPSDLEDFRFMDPLRSPDLTSTRKSVELVPQNKQFLQVPVFIEFREAPVAPTIWGHRPQRATCPYCHKTERTITKRKFSSTTVCCCWVLFLIGGVCFLSFCMCCQETHHYCSKCNMLLGHRGVM